MSLMWRVSGKEFEVTSELVKQVIPERTVLNTAAEQDINDHREDGGSWSGLSWFARKIAVVVGADVGKLTSENELSLILALASLNPPLIGWDHQTYEGYVANPTKSDYFPKE